MTDANPPKLELMPRLVIGLAILSIAAGVLWYGVTVQDTERDAIYQHLVFKTFYPVEALFIALLLAYVPYLLIRGPVARIVRWWRGGASVEVR
ncbi:MAG: hypothetical protein WB902_00595 [Acetobacteraceae bacterium]|jgi:hypothetical protein